MSPVHHVDSSQVDQGLADLQAEQHQGDVGQLVLLLRQVVPQLKGGQALRKEGVGRCSSSKEVRPPRERVLGLNPAACSLSGGVLEQAALAHLPAQ